jgi:predicted permease
LWQRRFGGDPGVVGTTLPGSDPPATVVGVMPREFDFPHRAEVWLPVGPELEAVRLRNAMSAQAFRGLGVLYVVGRLKHGVSRESAQDELSGISRRLAVADGVPLGLNARVIPLLDHHLGENARRALEALAVASMVVLLLACANASVLLLVQAARRRTELAVRRALGAGALRAALHQVAEATLLAVAGGLAGAALATGAVRGIVALGPGDIPALEAASVDGRALAFGLGVTVAAGLVVALMPAGLASRLLIAQTLKAGAFASRPDRRGFRVTGLLVAAEVALSVVLLVGAGLLVRSLGKLLRIDLGFRPEGALSFSVDLAQEKYETPALRRALYRALLERVAALPGVVAAGAVHNRPLAFGAIGTDHWVVVEGRPLDSASVVRHRESVNWEAATPGYFRAVGTRLIAGRAFSEQDGPEAPKVVVVSESLARRCWPSESAVGKRLATDGARVEGRDGFLVVHEWQTVVGVVEDARYRGIQAPRLDVFVPYTQANAALHHVVVRTSGDPLLLTAPVREQLRALDPQAALGGVTSMTRVVEQALAPWRFASALLGGFALAGIALAGSGLLAVLQSFVAGSTREIAIRVALGATPRRVRAFVLRQGLAVTGSGVVAGFVLALLLARSLAALLVGVDQRDPLSYLSAAGLVALVAVVACLSPARRASRVDPATALRAE